MSVFGMFRKCIDVIPRCLFLLLYFPLIVCDLFIYLFALTSRVNGNFTAKALGTDFLNSLLKGFL